jgi:hypothetical protein
MTRKPMTPREVEQCRIVARDYPKGIKETVRGLIDTIEDQNRIIANLRDDLRNRSRSEREWDGL